MKWLGLGIALVAANGCCLDVVQGTVEHGGITTASSQTVGASSGGISPGGQSSTGSGVGGASSTGGSGGVNGGGGTGCNPPCGPNATCITDTSGASSCQCYPNYESCPTNQGAACVNIELDNNNCGGCGTVCSSLESCLGATCTCDATICLVDAGAFCVDTGTDPAFCGSCGNVCSPPGTPCVGGMCACSVGQTYCTDSTLAGVSTVCTDLTQDPLNCGTCNNDCSTSYAAGSTCDFSLCACNTSQDQLCVNIPTNATPTCDCETAAKSCATPSFVRDVYPFLAQQTGAFGCSASGCHSGDSPPGGLGFLDDGGLMDAGMAYAELVGINGGGGSDGAPFCDAGVPGGAPATQCACVSRVAPGDIYGSYLIDVIANDIPGNCAFTLPMPTDGSNWLPLSECSQALLEQWVTTGATP